MIEITSKNIESFRGALDLKHGDLPYDIWMVFDKDTSIATETCMATVEKLISTKNQLLDPKFVRGEKKDPRQTAFDFMLGAALGRNTRRAPLKATKKEGGFFLILDGNATAQVLMLVGWTEAPIQIVSIDEPQNLPNLATA